ncbi:MAG: MFS transporter [Verrucomicrobiales bacterium]
MPDTDKTAAATPVDHLQNPKLFVVFRVLFNSRFYYPVYALMFLDFGLTQEQFATLNFAWAIAIVLLEIPSGALADQIGRRPLVIGAAVLMMVEMSVMFLMPVVDRSSYEGDPEGLRTAVWLLFAVFMVNRILSGAAEAAASGADEALAYDSLPVADRELRWSRLTTILMKSQAAGFIVVTLIGAAVYDPAFVNASFRFLGIDLALTQSQTLKIPIGLTLLMSFGVLGVALRMREPPDFVRPEKKKLLQATKESFARTMKAGAWIAHTPAALMLLLVGLFFDSIMRLYYTVGSIWLTTIGYDPAHLGLISIVGSVTGIFAAILGERLITRFTPKFNFRLLTILVFIGVLSLAFPVRYWSVLFLPAIWMSMRLLHFFVSNYLNRVTSAENRATVLSFRGLSMNLSYGILMWLYGMQTAYLRKHQAPEAADGEALTQRIFADAAQWWWVYFLAVIVGLALFRALKLRQSWNELLPPTGKR